jgi:hypothetical protein
MFRTASFVLIVTAMASTGTAWGQCQARGGSGGSAAARGTMCSPAMGSMNSVGSMQGHTNPYASAMSFGQTMQRQLAQQQYQKLMEDKQQRAERLALRQYWAAQRREQKIPPTGLGSPGQLAARSGNSTAMSLDFSPSKR